MNLIKSLATLLGVVSLAFSLSAQTPCNPNALEIPNNGIDEDCDGLDGLFLTLPPYAYLTAGQDFELYFRNTILSTHPEDYTFEITTSLPGVSSAEKWAFTPNAAQIGQYPATLKVKNSTGTVLASATTTLRISPNTHINSGPKKLLMLGHSFLDQGYMPYYLYNLLKTPGNPTNTFYGSKESWISQYIRFEGHGGQTWRWFVENPGSPLTYPPSNAMNVRRYMDSTICVGCEPDWMVIFMDVNDFCGYSAINVNSTLSAIDDTIQHHWQLYANQVIQSVRANAPECKIGICMVPPANAIPGAFDASFPTNPILNSRWRWQKIVSRLHFNATSSFGNRENENIYLIPTHLDLNDLTEYGPLDAIHPSPPDSNIFTHNGYNEMAKSIYAWLKHIQNEQNITVWYRDQDNDGYGKTADVLVTPYRPVGYGALGGDCDDTNPLINPAMLEQCNNNKDDNCNGFIDEDWESPVARCKSSLVVNIPASGVGTLTPNRVNNGSSDNCGPVSLSISQNTFTCSDIGFHFVVLTAVDGTGNVSECQTVVTISDTIGPKISLAPTPVPEVFIGPNGSGQLNLTDVVIQPSGDCVVELGYSFTGGNDYVYRQPVTFTCNQLTKTVPVSFFVKARDHFGNESAPLTAQTWVLDKTPPQLLCKNKTVFLGADGKLTLPATELIETLSDACTGATLIGVTSYQLDCSAVGFRSIIVSAKDSFQNIASCLSQVLVMDVVDSDGDQVTNCFDECPNDANLIDPLPLYVDADGDGFGSTTVHSLGCTATPGTSLTPSDCDDNNMKVFPGAYELFDGKDNDCDGRVDEGYFDPAPPSRYNPLYLKVFPNPANNWTQITTTSLQVPIESVRIFSNLGMLVQEVLGVGEQRIYLDLQQLHSGVYAVEVRNTLGEVGKHKLVVQH